MAKSKIDLEINVTGNDSVAQAEIKTKSLKTQLKDMKTLLASGTLDNNAFNKLAKEAGALQDRIGDVNNEVKNLADDSKNLTGIIGVAEGIAGGFAAVQGVTALLGDENEDLNKVMVKLQGSMAAVQGITAINNALQKNSAAMLLLANVQTKALAIGQQFLKVTTMGSVAATYALRAALIATGIGAIVVLVAALAGAFSDVAESTEDATKKQGEFNDKVKELNNQSLETIKQQSEVDKAKLKLKGATNDELIQKDIDYLKRVRNFREQEYNEEADNGERKNKARRELEKANVDIFLKEQEREQLLKDDADKKEETRNTKNKAAQEKLKTENEKKIAEALELEKNKFELENELNLNARKRGMTLEQQEIEDLRASYEQKRLLALKDAELTEKINLEIIAKTLDIQEKFRLEAAEKKKEEDKTQLEAIDKIKELNANTLEKQKELIEEKLALNQLEFDKNALQKEVFDAKKLELSLLLAAKEKEIVDKQKIEDEKILNAKKQAAQDTFNGINDLGEALLGQQFKNTAAGKGIALAQIATDTAVSISALIKNSEANPLNAPTSGLAGAIQFAAGFARISAGILKAKAILSGGNMGGSGSSGGGSTGGSSQPAPIRGFIPQGDNNQLNGVSKVVVLEKDITDVQNRVARIRDNATLS